MVESARSARRLGLAALLVLPWDNWGMLRDPRRPPPDGHIAVLDELAELAASDDLAAIRRRFERDKRVKVPRDIVSFINGKPTRVQLPEVSAASSS